ncbi:HNH endonuclease [Cyanobium sp. PCC 7001]|uniref:HNH endonuclease n=1 Tax=Cyanobium sp. PCC 7001 TaxID=180281 RepID=UPI0008FEEDCC|nr:HNH endonuclease [Cyanobium sp. PCC 7001]
MSKPDWTRDELVLALDLYFREPSARGSKTHPGVLELSNVLNSLPIHEVGELGEDFRNPNGVGMKLSNFLRFDPSYKGAGLKRGSHLEEEVWSTFSADLKRLQATANAIRRTVESGEAANSGPYYGEETEAPEGRVLTRIHQARERNAALIKKKKTDVLSKTGRLACEVCSFDFQQMYGEHGHGFAECHHTKPISKLMPGEKTRMSDLAIVCANCHRMLHRGRDWPSVSELKSLLKKTF